MGILFPPIAIVKKETAEIVAEVLCVSPSMTLFDTKNGEAVLSEIFDWNGEILAAQVVYKNRPFNVGKKFWSP